MNARNKAKVAEQKREELKSDLIAMHISKAKTDPLRTWKQL